MLRCNEDGYQRPKHCKSGQLPHPRVDLYGDHLLRFQWQGKGSGRGRVWSTYSSKSRSITSMSVFGITCHSDGSGRPNMKFKALLSTGR